VRELTNHNDGNEVEMYLAITGQHKGAAWCAAFVSWTFDRSQIAALHNAWAPAWFPPAHTIYTRGLPAKIIPDRADVFGIYYDKNKGIGHVGFVDSWTQDKDYVITVEGNSNDGNGRDGVYRKRRPKSNIYKVSRWV
jgi:CHAP domain